MASAPSAAMPDHSWVARPNDVLIWRVGLAALASLCVVYAVLPSDLVAVRDLLIYQAAEMGAIIAIVAGVYRFRPVAPRAWLCIAACVFLWWIGDLLWTIYDLEGRDPFPSTADAFYLVGYPVIAFALAYAVWRRRTVGVDARVPLDALLVTVIAALLAWLYLMRPVLDDPALSRWEVGVSLAYPLGDLLLLAIAARFVMGSSWNVASLRLLVLGLGLTMVGDTLFALDLAGGARIDRISNTLLLIGVVCVGVAALHPSMRAFTEEAGQPGAGAENVRQVLLGAAFLVPVAVLVTQRLRGDPLHFWATITALVIVTALVVARFTYVTNRARRSAEREAVLSRYAAELLRCTGEDELSAIAARTATELIGDGMAQIITAPGAEATWATHGFSAPIEVRGERLGDLIADGSPVSLRRAQDSLTVVASQLALAIERERLLETEREAAVALLEQNERLRELDEMKDQFVSSVSHELRTPLTSMVGYLELLHEGEAGELDEQQQHFVEIVNRNALRLNELVDDILFVARADAGRLSVALQPVDIGELSASAVESAQASAERKGLALQLSVADDVPELHADPTRLTQMLDNLISNAIKFTPSDGTVSVDISTRGDMVHVEVADTGVGVPADELGRLFQRFFRASTADVAQGTGLGLSIVKSIVDLHHGTVSVESTAGVGTTFSVDLPARVPSEASAATAKATT